MDAVQTKGIKLHGNRNISADWVHDPLQILVKSMDGSKEKIKEIENQIEDALWSLELQGELGTALEIYKEAETKLAALEIRAEESAYAELQRVLAYCLMRQGNLLRQMEKPREALAIGEREIAAARASQDDVTLARSLMSNGTNRILVGEAEKGLDLLEEAREIFENRRKLRSSTRIRLVLDPSS